MIRKTTAAALVATLLSNVNLPAQSADGVRLPDGTRLVVRLVEQLTSATAKPGDTVAFEVVEDVSVDGMLFIKQGTPARGTVVEAESRRRMGRSGTLLYGLTETKSVDGQQVRLRAAQEKRANSSVTSTAVATTAVAFIIPVAAPFVLLRKGKDVTVPAGTRVDAFVDGDHQLRRAAAPPAAATPSARDARGPRITNADVIGLRKAGLKDDLIISTIQSSSPSFSLSTSDLLELKKAAVSERVIEAMFQAR
jgi:hypothetical protein